MFKIYTIFDVDNLGTNNELFLFNNEFLLIERKIVISYINIFKKEKIYNLKINFKCLNIDYFFNNILIVDFKGFFHQFKIVKNELKLIENKNNFQFNIYINLLNLKKTEDNNFLFVYFDYDLKL